MQLIWTAIAIIFLGLAIEARAQDVTKLDCTQAWSRTGELEKSTFNVETDGTVARLTSDDEDSISGEGLESTQYGPESMTFETATEEASYVLNFNRIKSDPDLDLVQAWKYVMAVTQTDGAGSTNVGIGTCFPKLDE